MEDLIKALEIFLKYGDNDYPLSSKDGDLIVLNYKKEDIAEEDIKKLYALGFFWSDINNHFMSYNYVAYERY